MDARCKERLLFFGDSDKDGTKQDEKRPTERPGDMTDERMEEHSTCTTESNRLSVH